MNKKLESKDIMDIAEKLGIVEIGIIKNRRFEELIPILKKREETMELTGFEEEDIELRIEPKRTMNKCESIIVCIFPYNIDDQKDNNISKYARGMDYHFVIQDILNEMGERISGLEPKIEFMNFADSGPLVDRHLAFQAGLGFWGVNGNLINKECGSYFFIGYMLTNCEFDIYNEPLEDRKCMECGACEKACPGDAIKGDYDINPLKCKSYLTQKKGVLENWETEIIRNSNMVFGCDICQDVCPHNKNVQETNILEFKENLIYLLDENEIEELSNKKFKKLHGRRAFAWRGKGILKRNIDLLKGDKDGVE